MPASRMESRQSASANVRLRIASLPASRMESRQSKRANTGLPILVCQPQGWNQGKASGRRTTHWAKVCQPQGWNQGKARPLSRAAPRKFASLKDGIKAKRTPYDPGAAGSLPASRMESRQSNQAVDLSLSVVCQPQGWNQGKAAAATRPTPS